MKRLIILILSFVMICVAAGCGNEDPGEYITTVSEREDSTIETYYRFLDGKLDSVHQVIEYRDKQTLENEYASIKGAPELFCDLEHSGMTLSYSLTKECLEKFYSDVDADRVIATAEENGLKVITD